MLSILGIPVDNTIWLPTLIFFGRVTDVSIGTVRLICITRGRLKLAVILGFFETLIWILAISGTFAHLDRWINIVAYAAGFAVGNAVGMSIEKTLAIGTQIVQLISQGSAHAVAERLRFADMAITTMTGYGRNGPVSICLAVVPRRLTAKTVQMARQIDPDVHVTVEDAAYSSLERTAAQCPDKTPFKFKGKEPVAMLLEIARRRHRAAGETPIVASAA